MDLKAGKLKILSWNINGIRASKSPLKSVLNSLDADIICFQETKITRDQVDESTAIVEGYNAYFSFSRKRSGYSGVATYCKDHATPFAAEEGLGSQFGGNDVGHYGDETQFTAEELADLDSEGRAILTKHTFFQDEGEEEKLDVVVINVYCPRFDCARPERMEYKLQFHKLLQQRAEAILESGSHVVIVGDINCSHKPLDHCDPSDQEDFSSQPARVWLDSFLEANKGHFLDTFRYFHADQQNAFTCWSTLTSARMTNYGTRLDYIFADPHLVRSFFTDSFILPDIQGSDHCPVAATLNCQVLPSQKCPKLCAKFWPEFAGKQQKLLKYLCVGGSDTAPAASQPGDSSKGQKRKKASCKDLKTQRSIMGYLQSSGPNVKKEISPQEEKAPFDLMQQRHSPEPMGPKPSESSAAAWKFLLKGPEPAPLCKGHREPCVLRVVKKPGPNLNRRFYVCARGQGLATNPEARCNFFQWMQSNNGK